MMYSLSYFKKVRTIVKSFILLTLLKALLISNIRRYMVKSFDVIAIPACSIIVKFPDLYCCIFGFPKHTHYMCWGN